jgi:hypothetical protein
LAAGRLERGVITNQFRQYRRCARWEGIVDPKLKNLREWVMLLFALFCVLDLAGMQYGMILAQNAPDHPQPLMGQIIEMSRGSRSSWRRIYVTSAQFATFYAFLGAGAAALLATLGIVVAHGIRLSWVPRK